MTMELFEQRLATYLGPDGAPPVKHVFTMLTELLCEAPPRSALDVGCASGDLLAHLKRTFPGCRLVGVDTSEPLLEAAAARPELADATLVRGDGLGYRGEPVDLVTCFGVLGIYDEFEPVMEALLSNRAAGGRLVVHALFNPDDIDVRVLYRDNAYSDSWQRGFNVFSRARILSWLDERRLQGSFHDVVLPLDLPKRPHQPHRAHTIRLEDGVRRTTNGLCQLLPEALLVVQDRTSASAA